MDTTSRVRRFILENYYVSDEAELQADTHLITSGIVDSTGMLEVIGFLEREFGIKIEDREATSDNLASVGRICAFIDCKVAARLARAS